MIPPRGHRLFGARARRSARILKGRFHMARGHLYYRLGRVLLRLGQGLERAARSREPAVRSLVRRVITYSLLCAIAAWLDLPILPRREILTLRFMATLAVVLIVLHGAEAAIRRALARPRG